MSGSFGAAETGEQRQIRQTVVDVLDRHADTASIRRVMVDSPGYDRALWQQLSEEIGVGAMIAPESVGGLGLGFANAAVVIEELGRRLVPGPWIDTMASVGVLASSRTESGDALMAEVAGGAAIAVAAGGSDRSGSGISASPPVTVESSESGAVLVGRATMVPFGASADTLIVSAAGVDGPALYAVRHEDLVGHCESVMTLDQTRRLATIDLAGVAAHRVSACGTGADDVQMLRDLLDVGIAAESVGAAEACLEMTVSYLKVREQFGRPLGSFQALKHRCADHAVAVHGARAATRAAVQTAERAVVGVAGSWMLSTDAAVAKVAATDAFWQIAADAIQLHGGIGFTFEHDAHLYFKRAKANQHLYGTTAQLRARIGTAMGL